MSGFCFVSAGLFSVLLRVAGRAQRQKKWMFCTPVGNEGIVKRKYSLKKHKDFNYVYRRGKAVHCAGATLIVARGQGKQIHIGISVSKKVGNAVVRNRCKRRIREVLRTFLPQLPVCKKMIVVVRPCLAEWDHPKLCAELTRLFQKAGLLVPLAPSQSPPAPLPPGQKSLPL